MTQREKNNFGGICQYYREAKSFSTRDLICPHCNNNQSDSDELITPDDECKTYTCEHCNKEFNYYYSYYL